MLYFDRIEVSKEIDVNKASKSKECDVCHYWYFLNKGFKFKANVCNGCHDLLMMSINLSNTAISNINHSGYCCIISRISKSGAKKGNIMKHKFIIIYKKGERNFNLWG